MATRRDLSPLTWVLLCALAGLLFVLVDSRAARGQTPTWEAASVWAQARGLTVPDTPKARASLVSYLEHGTKLKGFCTWSKSRWTGCPYMWITYGGPVPEGYGEPRQGDSPSEIECRQEWLNWYRYLNYKASVHDQRFRHYPRPPQWPPIYEPCSSPYMGGSGDTLTVRVR